MKDKINSQGNIPDIKLSRVSERDSARVDSTPTTNATSLPDTTSLIIFPVRYCDWQGSVESCGVAPGPAWNGKD